MIRSTVLDIKVWGVKGPWKTKSSGRLMVEMAIPIEELRGRFLKYSRSELKKVVEDIRGLRIYTVRAIPKFEVGGGEFHRIREEIIIGLEGKIHLECRDLEGAYFTIDLDPKTGIWMPPFILHKYQALEDNSGIMIVCNTLFDPEDPRTHDTYPEKDFIEL